MNKFQGVYTRKKPSFLFSPPSSRGLLRAEFAIDAVPQSACSKMYFNVPSSQRTLNDYRDENSERKISKINATTALNI